ncbi:hypothetical protein J6E39_00530 [bacterium]|nr:hypothetical protein [bacterium]
MGKTLNELSRELKDFIISEQSDSYNSHGIRLPRYNNLKLSMDIAKNPTPHVTISISMSQAIFKLRDGEKESGSLGPDERYVLKWLNKSGTMEYLREAWGAIEKQRGKASASETEN